MNASGVLVVGSITADLTAFGSRMPSPGETILGNGFTLVLGGKGANQAISAARAGAATSMVGCVGDDLFQDVVLDGLRREGIETAHVAVIPGPTGVAHIRVDAAGENDIVMVPLANGHLTEETVEAAIEQARDGTGVLLLQLEIPLPAAVHAARTAHRLGITVVLDPAPAAVLDEDVWAYADIVTPNESEASALTGIEVTDPASARAAAGWFIERGVGRAVVTMGGQGAISADEHGCTEHLPYPAEAVDTTAAGDAFAGTLGAGLAAGTPWETALQRAMAAGALAVTVPGASPSLPRAAEITALIEKHGQQETADAQ